MTLEQLARQVKERMQLDVVRVAGDLSRKVTRVGTACGGLGQLFNYPEELAAMGAEVVVMGEVIDYTIRHALELGLALIETSHVGSENYGLKNLADLLQRQFPDLRVIFFDSGTPWLWYSRWHLPGH
jgi:putative NIF3 family GTP cyclohydrolase 1 type 2